MSTRSPYECSAIERDEAEQVIDDRLLAHRRATYPSSRRRRRTPARSATVGAMSRIDACGPHRGRRDAWRADDDERLEDVVDGLEVPAPDAAVIGRDDDRRVRPGGVDEIGEQSVDARRGGEVLVAPPSDARARRGRC